jgi:hypothetical protein
VCLCAQREVTLGAKANEMEVGSCLFAREKPLAATGVR